ncbi:MAG: hypothetical protein ACLGI9_01265, partial [Thermoanaerobaculia bacterium]
MKATTLAFLLFALPGLAMAQEQPGDETASTRDRDRERAAADDRRMRADLRLNALRFDNFFQAPEGFPQQEVDAWAGELRLAAPFAEVLEGYANLNYTTYDDPLEASQGV